MQIKYFTLLISFLLFTIHALAQTSPAKADEAEKITENAAPAEGKTIPVAEHFEGGQEAMYDFIYKELKYPPLAKRNRIAGQCIVSFTLNDDGSLSNFRILKNVGGGCGEEALRVVKLLKFNPPGYSLQTSIPITFKL
jgi:periplasmic protein TonB